MECPKWLEELMDDIAGCFETAGGMQWNWSEDDGTFEVKMFPQLMTIADDIKGLDGDIRLSVSDAMSYFDKDPDLQWHLSGSQEGAFHLEGTVNKIAVWIWFLETPPEVPAELLDDEPSGSGSSIDLN
jgi:hypothetical protein